MGIRFGSSSKGGGVFRELTLGVEPKLIEAEIRRRRHRIIMMVSIARTMASVSIVMIPPISNWVRHEKSEKSKKK